jgi:predicted transcriptional regulator
MWVQIKRAVAVRAREALNAQTQQWVEAAISNGVQKLDPGRLWMFIVQCSD